MKNPNEERTAPEPARKAEEVRREAPPGPPEDQRFFNESLEFGLRSVGRLLERRRKQR